MVIPTGSCSDQPSQWEGVSTYLDGEVEHQAVGVSLCQLVEEVSPGGVGDHLLQPGRCLAEERDGTGVAPSPPSGHGVKG